MPCTTSQDQAELLSGVLDSDNEHANSLRSPPNAKNAEIRSNHVKRDVLPAKRDVYPAPVEEYSTLLSPTGVRIRFKEPGKEGVCETTPGVKSYTGYIDLAPNMRAFFWFFESRKDPANDPVTLWLNVSAKNVAQLNDGT